MIKDKILRNKFVQGLYHTKAYFDIGVQQISWFTGKLPEIMGALYILEKFNVYVMPNYIILVGLLIFGLITVIGILFKFTGLFDSERKATNSKDPVMYEIYQMAVDYNNKHKIKVSKPKKLQNVRNIDDELWKGYVKWLNEQ